MFPATAQPTPASQSSAPRHVLAWATLLLASAAVFLLNPSYPLIEPDETRYAQIALNMIETGDWVTPMLDGQPYLDKPPLMYWCTALSLRFMGENEFAARFPSTLSAIMTIVVVYLLGSKIVGRRAAWVAAIALALCGGFVMAGRFVILDAMLTFFTTLCLLSSYLAVRETKFSWSWWALAAFACALGVLTKGPVALVLCAPPLVASGWLCADHTRPRVLQWAVFIVPMLLICTPWYIAVALRNAEFMDYFFWEHNFKRFTQGSNHREPFWFYIPVVLLGMFPTSLLMPLVGMFLASRSQRVGAHRTKSLGFLFCSAAWTLLFFSLSSCKLPTYILPAIPMLCLISGTLVDRVLCGAELTVRLDCLMKTFPQRTILTVLIVWMGLIVADCWIAGAVTWVTIVAASLSVAGTIATIWLWKNEISAKPVAWAATAFVGVIVLGFASAKLLATASYARSMHVQMATLVEKYPERLVVFFGEKPHAVRMSFPEMKYEFFPMEQRQQFVEFMARHQSAIVVTADEHIALTREAIASSHRLVMTTDHEHLYIAEPINDSVPRVARDENGERR
ncbi:phospholipid carrier-dependent glycosyltransferase [Stieleria varia]|uniref:Undecaprenyl phosphate-alpha-4-amino-4-deoxy-L-arabinose arabinosyl transferase n=1 Tax=Stieleria varia TaxID=2528005 RepID=A0A5C6AH38_9BACT|nr:phospholipid carrier-dependent glycosyltransferase [Stieleria varia]TWT98495.1 Undecaprenyl phosphate-alpha-4-amino-4-deoxy-L-arabinose arabinosyl transferase [Stieleria varia]